MCAGLAAAVGGAGRYLHLLDRRRVRAVHEARQAQRLGLARDLHDFVAHDVSGIVAQAQAGQVSKDPAIAQEALRRIEAAGLRALASMDRTVHLLSPGPARYGLADLPDLVEQYASDVTLELPPLEPPREVGAAAYRIVAEALTNIRRHAPATTRITVAVGQAADRLTTVVTNHTTNATPVRSSRRGGGLGLVRLTELVEALGGELEAGPVPGGWQVSATLPLGAAS
ncbi:sensor histidine kinase [Kribbella amoyensis]|nr:histidine kinase [Kribbella amoyensis]